MTTLFFIEHINGKVNDQSLKAISATKDLVIPLFDLIHKLSKKTIVIIICSKIIGVVTIIRDL